MSEQSGVEHLLAVVDRLREPGGCPWDREQTLESLKPYLVEECYELLDAIDGGDVDEHRDELGDVLLQVVLQARIRSEERAFDFNDVANHLADKLERRHPHVFGDVEVKDASDVVRNWDKIKRQEKREDGVKSIAAGIPGGFPALRRAQKIQQRAARDGFDWCSLSDVLDKVQEELDEIRQALDSGSQEHFREEVGDLLFAAVNLCRFAGLESEDLLNEASAKFAKRYDELKRRVTASGRDVHDCSAAELDAEWNHVKRNSACR